MSAVLNLVTNEAIASMNKRYLEWLDERQQTQRIEIVDRICIGRTCKGIDPQKRILQHHPQVSRDHAEISWTAGRLQILDTSRNGTWVNNIRMAAGSSKDLSDGDVIRIGNSVFRVVCSEGVENYRQDFPLTEMTIVSSLEEVVTSLVADMRGFTAYSQRHASSDVYVIMREIFDQFSKTVEDFNGTIKDFAGDAVFAFWEHQFDDPVTQAARACQAAVRQLQNFSRILVELGGKYADIEKLQMGWGITTGPIVLSQFGSRAADLAAVGDCVNLASRLAGMANKEIPENILICARTAELVENQFARRDLGLFTIRGREGRAHIFALSAP
jgi:adenylate cyclase